jgi:tetratricopeptide (TPR) repeat protein
MKLINLSATLLLLFFALPVGAQTSRAADEHFRRGVARYEKGDLTAAIADFDRALELHAQFVGEGSRRGDSRKSNLDPDPGRPLTDGLVVLDTFLASTYYNRGLARHAGGDLAGALADFERSVLLNPHDAPARNNLGSVRQERGDLDGAIADFSRAIALAPGNFKAWFNRGNARQSQGRWEEAIVDYNRVIELSPHLAIAFNNRGNARRANGELEKAIADYVSALEINPGLTQAYANRGLALLQRGEDAAAEQDFEKCRSLDRDFATALDAMIERAKKERSAQIIKPK